MPDLSPATPRVFQDSLLTQERALKTPSHKVGMVIWLVIVVAVRS
jgi:hypothetical protein